MFKNLVLNLLCTFFNLTIIFLIDHVNFVWMNGNNVYIPHSQTDHATTINPVFFDNSVPRVDIIQPTMVSIDILLIENLH